MPLNLQMDTDYIVNYQNILYEIVTNCTSIFDNFKFQYDLISKWIKLIKQCDAYTCENRNYYYNLYEPQTEMFEQEVYFSNSSIKLYFVVDNALQFIQSEYKHQEYESFLCSELVNDNWLQWSPFYKLHHFKYTDKPIIACEFPLGNKKFLLIDGNKRLTYSIINSKEYINMFLLNSHEVIKSKVLSTPFERCYYSMITDLTTLLQIKRAYHLSDDKLLTLSKIPKEDTIAMFL